MTDVFISYAREDREWARKLASLLEARGCSVWWDRNIIAGDTFDQVIERELDTAKCVVVLWSRASISSEWVKSEAAAAAERGVLVPALIETAKPPLEFRRKQAATLIGWDGDPSDGGFLALWDGIAAKAKPDPMSVYAPLAPPRPIFRWNRRWTLGGIAALVGLAGFEAYEFLVGPGGSGDRKLESDLTPRATPLTTRTPTGQDDWRWCLKCEGLWFNGHPTKGFCPAGGTHERTGNGDYVLTLDAPAPDQEDNWRWCHKCEGLWFNGHPTKGTCPAGGTHESTGSGNYSLDHVSVGRMQAHWRRCVKCEGLWFNGHPTSGTCPAGGSHKDAESNTDRGNYALSF